MTELLNRSELTALGVQYGTQPRWKHPRMDSYIYSCWKRCVLDVNKIMTHCTEARAYIIQALQQRQKILFISTKKRTQEIVKAQAQRCGVAYITRYEPGNFTNWNETKKRIGELQALNFLIQKESFQQLTKKQQKVLTTRKQKLDMAYGGLLTLSQPPQLLFIIGLNKERVACREARKMQIPIIAVCNTNCNPALVDVVLPGNDDSIKSVEFFATWIADSVLAAHSAPTADEAFEGGSLSN